MKKTNKQLIAAQDAKARAIPLSLMADDAEFAGAAEVAGLEHLGAGILDASGQPSGSPANWANLRGATHEPEVREPDGETVSAIGEQFAE